MRCLECNIDVGESYTRCPLCNTPCSGNSPVLKDLQTALYPVYTNPLPPKQKAVTKDRLPSVFSATGIAATVLSGVLALFNITCLWQYGAPILCLLLCVLCFACGIKERGGLLHFGGGLLCLSVNALICLVIGITTRANGLFCLCYLSCLLLFALLSLLKKQRMKHQLDALFHL